MVYTSVCTSDSVLHYMQDIPTTKSAQDAAAAKEREHQDAARKW